MKFCHPWLSTIASSILCRPRTEPQFMHTLRKLMTFCNKNFADFRSANFLASASYRLRYSGLCNLTLITVFNNSTLKHSTKSSSKFCSSEGRLGARMGQYDWRSYFNHLYLQSRRTDAMIVRSSFSINNLLKWDTNCIITFINITTLRGEYLYSACISLL